MSKYTMKDMQEAQDAMQFYDSMQKRIAELETENKHLRTINDINENNIESLKFIQQHLTVETTPRTCGECAHLRHLDPKKDSYNREAYAKRPWGDCHIYERSPEYQRMVENHFHGCGWRYAPGRSFDQPACQHFTPKKP